MIDPIKCAGTSASGWPCKKAPILGRDVCELHALTPEQRRAVTARAGRIGGSRPRVKSIPTAAKPHELLDSREKIIEYLSMHRNTSHGKVASSVANAAIRALESPRVEQLEAENEALCRIIEKYLPQGRPLLDELRAVK